MRAGRPRSQVKVASQLPNLDIAEMHWRSFRLKGNRSLADGIGPALADEDAVELGAYHAVPRGDLEPVPFSVGLAGLGPRLLVPVAPGTLGAPQWKDLS